MIVFFAIRRSLTVCFAIYRRRFVRMVIYFVDFLRFFFGV